MKSEYLFEIDDRVQLDATPVALAALSFASPHQSIATVLSESRSILLFESGQTMPSSRIRVSDDPVDICGGGRDRAYVACRAAGRVDVISQTNRIKRIELPGQPQAVAWNGSFNPIKQKIFVCCEMPGASDDVVCIIDEETLTISNMVKVGRQPRGISLDQQRKHLLVTNYGSDSISVLDQFGARVLATLPTAGRPWTANASWSDPEDLVISLRAGGVLQRLDATIFPPILSGLTSLQKPTSPPTNLTPECCLPIGEDHLWIAPDRFSEALALIVSSGRKFEQIGYYPLGSEETGTEGLGQIAISGHGLPGTLCIANRKRKQLMFARLLKQKVSGQ